MLTLGSPVGEFPYIVALKKTAQLWLKRMGFARRMKRQEIHMLRLRFGFAMVCQRPKRFTTNTGQQRQTGGKITRWKFYLFSNFSQGKGGKSVIFFSGESD